MAVPGEDWLPKSHYLFNAGEAAPAKPYRSSEENFALFHRWGAWLGKPWGFLEAIVQTRPTISFNWLRTDTAENLVPPPAEIPARSNGTNTFIGTLSAPVPVDRQERRVHCWGEIHIYPAWTWWIASTNFPGGALLSTKALAPAASARCIYRCQIQKWSK